MTELAFRDPRDELNKTRFTQPALLTHEVACLEAFRTLVGDRVRPCSAPAIVSASTLRSSWPAR